MSMMAKEEADSPRPVAEGDPSGTSPNRSSGSSKVLVDVLWGMGLIWNEVDVERLKAEHNVHGSAVGSCPGHLQQNDVHGLPVQYQPEAVAYLLEKGAVDLGAGSGPEKDGKSPVVADEAFLAKIKERGKLEFPLIRDTPVVDASGHPGSRLDFSAEKLAAYRKMKELGYAVTDGRKFGAHYLVYETNPDDAHAFLTLRVAGLEDPIDPLRIIASARVAHGARKHMVIASVAGEGEGVSYLTFSPEGGFPAPKAGREEGEEEGVAGDEGNPEAIDIGI